MPKTEYAEIDTLRDEQNPEVISVITARQRPSGLITYSFSILKEFQRREGGPVDRTSYLNTRHLGAMRRLLDKTEERIDEERERIDRERRAG